MDYIVGTLDSENANGSTCLKPSGDEIPWSDEHPVEHSRLT